MTIRTIQQKGVAFGTQPANITAKINDVIVYQGLVTTLNEPEPELPNSNYKIDNVLFTYTVPEVSFAGQQVLEISIDDNATLLISQIGANYSPALQDPSSLPPISSGPDGFADFRISQFGPTYINGVLQTVDHGELDGQWWWTLPPGGTFVENYTILAGME